MVDNQSRETAATDPSAELMRLINGYQISQALHVAVTLGVADHLKDGSQSSDALARACSAHPASLYRLLRALAAVGVFHEAEGRRFSLTPLGTCLTGDARARGATTRAGSGRLACGSRGATCCTVFAPEKARPGSPAGWTPGPTATSIPRSGPCSTPR